MDPLGAFTFVLHHHYPFVRRSGFGPYGEAGFHEFVISSTLPLLSTLYDLVGEGVNYRLTLSLSPSLVEQLAHSEMQEHLDQYLGERSALAQQDAVYFQQPETENSHLSHLAGWYQQHFDRLRSDFDQRFNRDLVGAFRRLQDEGFVEIIAGAATHAYLPLLGRDSSVKAQIETGISSYKQHFGRQPTGFWLTGCGYRPAVTAADGLVRPGLEHFLAQSGIKVFPGETHAITGGPPVGIANGEVLGPFSEIRRRFVLPRQSHHELKNGRTIFLPYSVGDSGVTVIGRSSHSSMKVWGIKEAYPGDVDYRENYRRAGTSGLQYWRISGHGIEMPQKDYYHPEWATYKVDQHAEHFAHMIGDLLRDFHNSSGHYGVVAPCFNAEFFGQEWFEGISWLGAVLRHLVDNASIDLTTLSQFAVQTTSQEKLTLPEHSWGVGGEHFVWENVETRWIWSHIHEAEARMEQAANRTTNPSGDEALVLNQAARELMLAQCSDWPALITTGQSPEYAAQRLIGHLTRFDRLLASLDGGRPDSTLAAEYGEEDHLFPDVDWRCYTTQS